MSLLVVSGQIVLLQSGEDMTFFAKTVPLRFVLVKFAERRVAPWNCAARKLAPAKLLEELVPLRKSNPTALASFAITA